MARHPGRGGAAWRRVRAQVLAASNICIRCGKPIDLSLSGRHRMGPTVDHRVSLHQMRHLPPTEQRALALNPANLGPAHNACNASKGKGGPTSRTSHSDGGGGGGHTRDW